MKLPQSISDNLRFLVVEVERQLRALQHYFSQNSTSDARFILDRRGYALNLKQSIHNTCTEQLATADRPGSHRLKAVESVAANLERISDLCRYCVQQTLLLPEVKPLELGRFNFLLQRIVKGVQLIEKALQDNDTDLALKIGRTKQKLEVSYRKTLHGYVDDLSENHDAEVLIRGLFVAHAIEQMGYILREVSEAILSSHLGQPMDMNRYHALSRSVEDLLDGDNLTDIDMQTVAETRSGSGISAIKSTDDDGKEQTVAIFKDGNRRKLKEEKQGVESWHEKFPGLAPRIIKYKKRGESAALLIEHLDGWTFEHIVLQGERELRQQALTQLTHTLEQIWAETRRDKVVAANFMRQMDKRLVDVFALHPGLDTGATNICGLPIESLQQLGERATALEATLSAPFAVYIHGDFNLDNIIFDPAENSIRFIDLHRSNYQDYVQDVSVFMVSNYRLQVFDVEVRQHIYQMIIDFYQFARDYAQRHDDRSFEVRLALGLARSLATSTRFILDQSMSRGMLMRARYLLEQVVNLNHKSLSRYQVPVESLFRV